MVGVSGWDLGVDFQVPFDRPVAKILAASFNLMLTYIVDKKQQH